KAKRSLRVLTRSEATLDVASSSRAIETVTGSVETLDTVTSTPGRRAEKVFVDDVIVCSAAVPVHSVASASCAVRIWVIGTEVPEIVKAFSAPVSAAENCTRY